MEILEPAPEKSIPRVPRLKSCPGVRHAGSGHGHSQHGAKPEGGGGKDELWFVPPGSPTHAHSKRTTGTTVQSGPTLNPLSTLMRVLASTPSLGSSSSSKQHAGGLAGSVMVPSRDGHAASSFSIGTHEVQPSTRRKSWVPLVHRGQRLGTGDRGLHAAPALGSCSFSYGNTRDQPDAPSDGVPEDHKLLASASIALPATQQDSGATKVKAQKLAYLATSGTRTCGPDQVCSGSSSRGSHTELQGDKEEGGLQSNRLTASSHADHGPRHLKHSERASKPLSPTTSSCVKEGCSHSGPHTESPFAQAHCQQGINFTSAPLPFLPENPKHPYTPTGPHSSPALLKSQDQPCEITMSASPRSQRARQLLRVDDSNSSLSPSASSTELHGPSKCTSLCSSHQTSMLSRNSLSPPTPAHALHNAGSASLDTSQSVSLNVSHNASFNAGRNASFHASHSASFNDSHPATAIGCPHASEDPPPVAPSSTSSTATTAASHPLPIAIPRTPREQQRAHLQQQQKASHPLTIAIPRTPHEQQRAHLQLQEGLACGSAPAGCYMDTVEPARLGPSPTAHLRASLGSSPQESQVASSCMRSYLRRHSSLHSNVMHHGHQDASPCPTSPIASRHFLPLHHHDHHQQQQQQDVLSPSTSIVAPNSPPSPPTLSPSPKTSCMRTRALARHQHQHQHLHSPLGSSPPSSGLLSCSFSKASQPHSPLGSSPPSTSLLSCSSPKAGLPRRMGCQGRRNSSEPMLQQVFQATSNALRHCSSSCNNGFCNHHHHHHHHHLSLTSSSSSSGSQSRMLREQHSGSRHQNHEKHHSLPHHHHHHHRHAQGAAGITDTPMINASGDLDEGLKH